LSPADEKSAEGASEAWAVEACLRALADDSRALDVVPPRKGTFTVANRCSFVVGSVARAEETADSVE
jgi:hypothetical protein